MLLLLGDDAVRLSAISTGHKVDEDEDEKNDTDNDDDDGLFVDNVDVACSVNRFYHTFSVWQT